MAYELQSSRDNPFQAARDQALRMLQMLQQSGLGGQRQQGEGQGAVTPPAEAIEDENAYLLTLEIPGVNPQDVDVSVVGNSLTIKAERRRQHGQQGDAQRQGEGQQGQQGQQGQGAQSGQRARHVLFSEIEHGTIRREFGLPEDADRNRIAAEFRNGLLTLTVPKSQEQHQRRKIEIKTNS